MRNYSALSQYLADASEDHIELSFAKVEELIGDSLPASAREHRAWWANESRGTHSWAHLWLAVGWACASVDFDQGVAIFERNLFSPLDTLEALRPSTKETIFDLLQRTRISTDKWLFKENGAPVSNVKANPNFCYDWSFGSIQEGYALCIWHETLSVLDERIVFSENMRELAENLGAAGRASSNDSGRRSRSIAQAARARAFDDALNTSHSLGIPVSVILTQGDRRTREELGENSSHVDFRSLDAISWFVHEYDATSGKALLVRGVRAATSPPGIVDIGDKGPPDELQLRAIKVRQGQAQFRTELLAAYKGSCAVTRCNISELLEAAHIRPHASEPNYRVTNGLLLRADIHTLYDLHLLSVDSRLRIRVAPALLRSEYKDLDGKELRHPAFPSQLPDHAALAERYAEFRKRYPV